MLSFWNFSRDPAGKTSSGTLISISPFRAALMKVPISYTSWDAVDGWIK